MLKPIGVRVDLSYSDRWGAPIKNPLYPVTVLFRDIAFADDVTLEIILGAIGEDLREAGFPNGFGITWAATDAQDGRSH